MIKYTNLQEVQSDCDVFAAMPHVNWTAPQLFHAWQAHGNRSGLLVGEIVENFSIINGKFCASAHYVAALAARTGELTRVESVTTRTEAEGMVVTCTVARGEGREMTVSHSESWARAAGYFNRRSSPWNSHLEDMLRKTSMMKLYRALFPDAVAGLYDPAEMSHSQSRREPTPAPRPVQAPQPEPAPAPEPKSNQGEVIGYVADGHLLTKEEYEVHLAEYPTTERIAELGFSFASAMALSRDPSGAEYPLTENQVNSPSLLGDRVPHPALKKYSATELARHPSFYFAARSFWACDGLNLDYAADAIDAWAKSGSWADAGALLIRLASANTENAGDRSNGVRVGNQDALT